MSVNKEKVSAFFADIEKYPMLCQSCGMCQGVCPVDAIELSRNFATQFVPHYDSEKCIGCMKCVHACPVRSNTRKTQTVIGSYYKIYIAKNGNQEHVKEASSGGVITALLEHGIQTGVFDEVLTVSNQKSPIVAQAEYTKDPKRESGSKYISAPLCTIYDKKKKLAATALPCQAKAIRKQSKDTFLFGLFCSKLSLEDLINYVTEKIHTGTEGIEEITYRRGSWPGKFTVKYANGTVISQKYNRSPFNSAYNSYNFSGSGCLLCDDYFSQEADISFGDPWGRPQYQENYLGETIMIVRSKRGLELVESSISEGIITAEEFDLEKVIKGHLKEIYNKKTALIQRIEYLNSYTDAMQGYDTNLLVKAKNFSFLNRYAIKNNWKRRTSKEKYKKIFRKPIHLMFVERFLHAFLLTRRLKGSGNYRVYLDIARTEVRKVSETDV